MDKKRKKELLEAYKFRRPEMGIIAYHCKETGDVFLDISKDTNASFNGTNMKLSSNLHPNKDLQSLWNKYGAAAFERTVLEVLKYDDPHKDHSAELEELLEKHLAANPKARRMWR